MKKPSWRKYALEFLSIFIAVILAFALNNWNDNRRDRIIENKILVEIRNGLEKDIDDIQLNTYGHNRGLESLSFWGDVIVGEPVDEEAFSRHFFDVTRDFVSIQNRSGYESLKSKGLELIQDDSLRIQIISIYEYDFATLEKLEEDYAEMQFHHSYFNAMNDILAPYLTFGAEGQISLKKPLNLSEKETATLQSIFWKIGANRYFIIDFYKQVELKVVQLIEKIELYLQE